MHTAQINAKNDWLSLEPS